MIVVKWERILSGCVWFEDCSEWWKELMCVLCEATTIYLEPGYVKGFGIVNSCAYSARILRAFAASFELVGS